MAKSVGVHEAKARLSRLLDEVISGEEVVITRRGKPAARLLASGPGSRRAFGIDRGRVLVPEDFDAPLALDAFEP